MSHEPVIEYRIFGRMLKEAREREGRTQSEVAELVDLSVGSYRNLEAGRQGIYLKPAIHLCNILGIDMGDLQQRIGKHSCGIEVRRKVAENALGKLEKARVDFVNAQKLATRLNITLPGVKGD